MSDYACWGYKSFPLTKEEYDYLLAVDFIKKQMCCRNDKYFWIGLPLVWKEEILPRLEGFFR